MTFQPYPAGSAGQQQPAGQAGRPQPVRVAVILMYAGAALSAVSAFAVLALSGRIKSAVATSVHNAKTARPLTAAQLHSLESFYVILITAVLLIAAALWVWMAVANGRGRGWARVMASVLFGISTVWLVLTAGRSGPTVIFTAIGWLIGLAATIFLWRRETTGYIARSRPGIPR